MWVSELLFTGLFGKRNMDLRGGRGVVKYAVISVKHIVSCVVGKVNNVESLGEVFSWYHIPSENKSFFLFIGPIRLTGALLLLCNIKERGGRNRGKKFPLQLPTNNTGTFLTFMSLSSLFLRKIKSLLNCSYRGWNNSSVHHRQDCSSGTSQGLVNDVWTCVGVCTVHMCINMNVIWFAEKKTGV